MNKLIPEVRFVGFTDDWEERKLGEIVKIKSGWSPSNFKMNNENGISFVKVDDLNYSNRVQKSANLKVCKVLKYPEMKKGSIIFPKRGAAIMTNKVRILGEDSYMDTNMMALEPHKIDGDFLYTFVYKTGLYKIADTSTIPQINNKHIEPYNIELPELVEQKKIGNFFKQLDETITLQERKLALLKEQKKGFLQKMFPKEGEKVPEIRFEGFTDDWEERKLGEIAEFSKGKGYTKKDLTIQGKEIILYGSLYTQYEAIIKNVNTFANEIPNSIKSSKGDVIIPSSGETSLEIARASVVASAGIILGGDLNIIKFNQENINSIFFTYFISNGVSQKRLSKLAQGNSVVHLYNSDLSIITLFYPKIKEQTKIGNFFKQLDDTITLEQGKLDSLKELKKAYLQKMFV